jgi:predicted transglutaminase-like cysteine proteinase
MRSVPPHGLALWRPLLLACAFALVALSPRAYDTERMSKAAQRHGPRAVLGVRALQPVLAGLAEADAVTRLDAVNRFYNRRILFAEDAQVWRVDDHWASPLETMQQGMGDCEDYAIAKYFSLLAAGMQAAQLRLVYVRLQVGGAGGSSQPHMVLAYYADASAEPQILDNLVTEIRPASRRPDLTPVFSFNSEGLWQGNGSQRMGDPVERLSRWREVLRKAREEGFL